MLHSIWDKERIPAARWMNGLLGWALLGMTAAAPPAGGAEASASDPLATCQAAFEAAPGERGSVRCFRQVGADPEHRQAVTRRLEALHAEHPDNPWIPYDLAAVLWPTHSPRVAELYGEAARLFEGRGNVEGQIDARRGRLRALSWQEFRQEDERQREIDREWARMERLAAHSADPDLALQVRVERAEHHLGRAHLEAAWQLLQQDAERIEAGTVEPRRERAWRRVAGKVAHDLGRFREARGHLRRWLEIEEDFPQPYGRASVLEMLARIHLSSAVPSEETRREQERLLMEALQAAEEVDNVATQAVLHGYLGRLRRGEPGRRHLETCIELSRRLGDGAPAIEAPCLSSLAVLLAARDEAEARRRLEQARERARAAGDPWTASVLDVDALRVDWATRPREAALERAVAAIRELEGRLLTHASEADIRTRVSSRWLDPHYWVAGRLLSGEPSRRDLERAFRMIEGRRGLGLAAATGRPPGEPVSLAEAQAALRADEALLVFLLGDWQNLYGEFEGGGWLLVLTREDSRAHRLPGRGELTAPVERLAAMQDPEDAPGLLARLHRQLLEDALSHLPSTVEHLILLPDLPLHGLPFAALAPMGGSPLAERYRLSRVPSVTLWHAWRGRTTPPRPEPALVLVDPRLSLDGAAAGDGSPSAVETGLPSRRELGPLPHARREGRMIRHRLGWDTLVLVGPEASEAALEKHAPHAFAVLHLAAHAVGSRLGSHPTAVYLAPGEGRDGVLTPAEIEGLALDDQVVVLAACETAAGEAVRGEGVLSLGRAFLAAGARSVVASLWRLPDAEAADTFEEFYRRLAAGDSVVAALNASQRQAAKLEGKASAWAGLVVLGDGGHVPFPGGRPWWGRGAALHGAVLIVACGLILLVVWAARRGRRRAA